MFTKILIILAILLAVFLVVVAFQPSTYSVTRSTSIAAAPSVVFAHVNDLHKWSAWSPWEKLDPAMKRNFEGPPAGVGAIYGWEGNREVGAGRMTIVESRPSELVGIKLEFFKPMAGVSDTRFVFKGDGNQTAVTWSMSGTNDFMGRAFCLFMSMDKMVGGQFAQGLADLKLASEKGSAK